MPISDNKVSGSVNIRNRRYSETRKREGDVVCADWTFSGTVETMEADRGDLGSCLSCAWGFSECTQEVYQDVLYYLNRYSIHCESSSGVWYARIENWSK